MIIYSEERKKENTCLVPSHSSLAESGLGDPSSLNSGLNALEGLVGVGREEVMSGSC